MATPGRLRLESGTVTLGELEAEYGGEYTRRFEVAVGT
jgi:hypothetical protein